MTSENPNQTDTPQVKSSEPKNHYQKNDPILSTPEKNVLLPYHAMVNVPCTFYRAKALYDRGLLTKEWWGNCHNF